MADIEVFGIGLDTSSAVRNAKNLEKALLDVSKSSGKVTKSGESMAGAMLKSQIAFAALSKAANFLTDQLKQSVTVGASFEQQMAKVGAVSKATAEQQKALSAAAKEMGKTTQFSATEAATALEAMSRAGFKAQQSIAALPKVLQLSAASGVSLGESADIVTNVMSSMGKQVSDLNHVNNVLVETFTSSNTTLESLASSISFAGGIAATTGVSFEQLNGFLGIFGNAGVSGTRAGTALRQAMATLIDPTKKAADTLKSLNVEVGQNLVETLRDLENAGASSKDMIAIFGTEAGGALLTLQQSGGIAAVEEMAHQLKNVGDVADEIAEKQMNTLQGSFTKLGSAIEGLRISIFEDLIRDDLKIFIDGLTESIQANEQSFRAVVNIADVVIENMIKIGSSAFSVAKDYETLQGQSNGLVSAFAFVGKGTLTLTKSFSALAFVLRKNMEMLDLVLDTYRYLASGEIIKAAQNFGLTFKTQFLNVGEALVLAKEGVDQLVLSFDQIDRAAKKRTNTNQKQTESNLGLSQSLQEVNREIKVQTRDIKESSDAKDDQTNKTRELKERTDDTTEALRKVSEAQRQQEVATGRATQAINQQAQAQAQAAQAAERASRFSGGSSFGSEWSDYVKSQGFSIVTQAARPRATQPTQTMSFGGFGGGIQQSTRASANLGSLLTRYERLSEQITDFITKDVSLDIKLADAQQELRNLSVELASLNEGQLEERIKLSEQYFAQVQAVDRLQTQVAAQQQSALNQQKSSAEGINGILFSVLEDLDSLTAGDISSAIPVDKFELLKQKFEATSEAIDKIDFSELTASDEQLIVQFQNVSKTFLDQAQTVFGTDANYSKIKQNVKNAFDSLAANLVTATSEADPTTFKDNLDLLKTSFAFLDEATKNLTTSSEGAKDSISGEGNLNSSLAGLKTNSDSATSALSGDGKLNSSIDGLGTASTTTKTKTGSFAETLASLETQLDENSTATQETKKETTDLSNTLTATNDPLATTSVNLQAIAGNTASVFAAIAENSRKLRETVEGGGGDLGTPATPEIDPIQTFQGYELSPTGQQLRAVSGTGEILGQAAAQEGVEIGQSKATAIVKKLIGKKNVFYDAFGSKIGETLFNLQGQVVSSFMLPNKMLDYQMTNQRKESAPNGAVSVYGYDYYAEGMQPISYDDATLVRAGIPSNSSFFVPFSVEKPELYARGAWNINGSVQPAMLHRGEMVIRQDDAPAVRSYLSSTGASSKYGAPMSEAPSYDTARTIELLSLILEQLRDQRDPTVYLNARKVSEELQRYRGLSA